MPLLASFDDALAAAAAPTSSGSSRPKQSIVGGLFSHSATSSSSVDWNQLALSDLTSHSHGLCSSVYRRALSTSAIWPYDRTASSGSISSCSPALSQAADQAGGLSGWVCIKRVQADEQPRPHSVSREIALLDLLSTSSSSAGCRNIAALLAAIHDTSDPFGAVVDIVMPLYAASLEEVLQEPSLTPSLTSAEIDVGESPRPGNSISHLWSDSPAHFIHSVSTQLLSGLAFLHDNKVAHRDVKPSNVLLSHDGVVKIIDLGTAYTTSPLADPLQSDSSGSRSKRESQEEWKGGKMVCQVGTGQFRAPELLFSPVGGYDAFAIDVWAAAVTLAHFFTPLVAVPRTEASEAQTQDERQDWQRAFESDTALSSQTDSDSSVFWEEDASPFQSNLPETASGYSRTPLFQPDTGDIGLAASIFATLGLPTSTAEWPEAQHFQPPLERLPFAPTQGKGLLSALPLFDQASQHELNALVNQVILPALSLSAAKRPPVRTLLAAIETNHPPP